jgi:hypothetical protein
LRAVYPLNEPFVAAIIPHIETNGYFIEANEPTTDGVPSYAGARKQTCYVQLCRTTLFFIYYHHIFFKPLLFLIIP